MEHKTRRIVTDQDTQSLPSLDENPYQILSRWYDEAQSSAPIRLKGAICLSTVDENNCPQARYVTIKEIGADSIVFCTNLESPKAQQIQSNNHVALTVWWDHTAKQIRIVGTASVVAQEEAERFFRERSRDAQLTSLVSQQSEPISAPAVVSREIARSENLYRGKEIPKPNSWGGFRVVPTMFEFLSFRDSRNHVRRRFTSVNGSWEAQYLQP